MWETLKSPKSKFNIAVQLEKVEVATPDTSEHDNYGVYPAIDIEASISRLMTHLVDKEQQSKANKFKQLLSVYRQNKDLISMGAYSAGADGLIDEAVAARKQLIDFIRQDIDVAVDYSTAESELKKLPFKHV